MTEYRGVKGIWLLRIKRVNVEKGKAWIIRQKDKTEEIFVKHFVCHTPCEGHLEGKQSYYLKIEGTMRIIDDVAFFE